MEPKETAMSTPHDTDTAEFPAPITRGRDRGAPSSSLVRVDLGGASHRGKVRPNNEDHFLLARFGRYLETVRTNLPADAVPARAEEIGYAMVVADGMGGVAAGEEASRLAITSLVNLVLSTPDWILRPDEGPVTQEVLERASERYEQVNQALAGEAQEAPRLKGYGTTMTLAFSLGRDLFVAHVGDSRAYLLRQGRLRQLTRDHTHAQELVEQ